MNERSLSKWESSTAEVLGRLKNALWMDVAPALERVILLLDELRAWQRWPAKFGAYDFDLAALDRAVALAKQVIKVSAVLERLTSEEEKCFAEFSGWLRYELEKVSALDGGDVRPRAAFQPRPVAHYLHHCLTESGLSPYLSFGLGSSPLESSVELTQVRAWLDGLGGNPGPNRDGAESEGLSSMLRRMKEELRGQLDAVRVGKTAEAAPLTAGDTWTEAMPVPAKAPSGDEAPIALPALLHVLAETVSGVMQRAVEQVGQACVVDPPIVVGLLTEPQPGELPRRVRSWTIREREEVVLFQAWIDAGVGEPSLDCYCLPYLIDPDDVSPHPASSVCPSPALRLLVFHRPRLSPNHRQPASSRHWLGPPRRQPPRARRRRPL